MAEDGTLEALQTTVDADARTATVELEHFSTYILADDSTKPEVEPEPEPEPETKPEPDPTVPNPTESKPAQDADGDVAEPENDYTVWIVIAAVVVLGGVCVFFVLRKKAVK